MHIGKNIFVFIIGSRLTLNCFFLSLDAPCPEGENLYGSHPFYIELTKGKAHGVVCYYFIFA